MATPPGDICPVCVRRPRIVVAVAHRTMRSLVVHMLARENSCWAVSAVDGGAEFADTVSVPPDLVVLDAADFVRESRGPWTDFPAGQTVVIGPEPDPSYRQAVLDLGAGAWLSRDDLGEGLSAALRLVLGCSHCPCPPLDALTERTTTP